MARVATLILLGTAGFASCSEANAPKLDSLLLVTLDTVRADHIGSYGYPLDLTPEIDALAAKGIVFEQVWAPMGMTLPSHATIMTGLQPRQHGALENTYKLAAGVVTLAEILSKQGYASGGFVGSVVLSAGTGINRGFRTFGQPKFNAPDGSVDVEGVLRRDGREVNEEALAWLSRVPAERPFFLWVHYFDPHGPFAPSKDSVSKVLSDGLVETVVEPRSAEFGVQIQNSPFINSLWARYAADIAETDMKLGELISDLREIGRLDSTWIVVTADHGEGLWEHKERGHGPLLFEEHLRVPLIVVDPRSEFAGKRVQEPVQLADVQPTILHALLGKRSVDSVGVDLLAWIESGEKPLDRLLFVERPHYTRQGIAGCGMGKPKKYSYGIVTGVISGSEKLIIQADGSDQLYDFELDPSEFTDLSSERLKRRAALRTALDSYLDENPTQPPGTRPQPSRRVQEALEHLGYTGD